MKYKISKYARKHNVTVRTVWNWIKLDKVKTERTATGGWLIVEDEDKKYEVICVYARVSSTENKNNLEKQKERLLSYCSAKGYIVSEIVTEIGSGLNDKRPKLEKILLDKSITKIIVEHKDRLARFGLNYIEKLLEIDGRKIEYLNPVIDEKEDIIQDFVSIITSFTARLYGQRRTKRNTEFLIKELEKNNI
jgi:predicted site-specific integrase-resolvase